MEPRHVYINVYDQKRGYQFLTELQGEHFFPLLKYTERQKFPDTKNFKEMKFGEI